MALSPRHAACDRPAGVGADRLGDGAGGDRVALVLVSLGVHRRGLWAGADPDQLVSGRRRDAAVWCAIGVAWAASFVAAYNASLAMLSPHTSMYIFWNFAFLPIWPLPMSVVRIYQTIGILLEVFVNPLNMVIRSGSACCCR